MLPISKALQGYWLDKKLQLSKETVKSYTYVLNAFARYLEDKPINEVTTQDVKAYLVYLSTDKQQSNRSINTVLLVLSSFFKWSSIEFDLPNPVAKIQKPKFTTNKLEPFTLTEVRALLQAEQKIWLKDVQILLLDSGLRISELCSLKTEDYDQNNGRLLIKGGKGDKDRIVYLGNKAQKMLWRRLNNQDCVYIFETRTKEPYHRNNVHTATHNLGKKLGIQANPHKYRHTFAVNFLRNGGNIKQLQEILGHTNLRTVEIYLKLADIDLERARSYSPLDNLR